MRLAKRILLYLTALMIIFIGAVYLFYNYYVSATLKEINKIFINYYVKDLKNTVSLFDYEISYLSSLLSKIDKNIKKENLKAYKIDFAIINDKSVSIKKINPDLIKELKNITKDKRQIKGILFYKDKFIFIAGKKFFSGRKVIVGRFLDNEFIRNLKMLTDLQLSISKSDSRKNKPYKILKFKHINSVAVFIKENKDYIHSYALIEPLNGKPFLKIHVKHPNLVYTLSNRFETFFIMSFVFFFGIFYFVLINILKNIFIEPVENITEEISDIAKTKNFDKKLPKSGVKELSTLSDAINWFTSSLKEYEKQLIEEKLLFESLATSAPVGIAIISGDKIKYKNLYFIENIGNLENLDDLFLKIPDTFRSFFKKAINLVEKRESMLEKLELKIITIDNKEKDFAFILSPIEYENKSAVLLIAVDLSEVKEKERQIEDMLYKDSTTGIPNRNAFINKIRELILLSSFENKKFTVIIIDIDNFKNINDTFGPVFGDELLKEIAHCLVKNFKNEKIFISRLSGDEFGITFECEKKEELNNFIEKIKKLFNKEFVVNGIPISLSISIGIALYPEHGSDAFELIKHADSALYKAKKEGKNRYVIFNEKFENELKEKLELEQNIKEALEKEEFYFVYQPILDLKTGNIVGAEALIRWQSKKLGFVSPTKFIPLAEESDLILEIDEYVLKKNIKFIEKLMKENINNIGIALNFSAKFFKKGLVYKKLNEMIKDKKLCRCIEIEITEREIMQDVDENLKTLNLLKSMGFKISIDDFGTGYSSLSYLKKLPIDLIKIDISFIRDIPEDINDVIITKTIINMAHNLGLQTIAEGIEREEQLYILKNEGCDLGQGYYFSKPLPEDEFLELLKKGNLDA